MSRIAIFPGSFDPFTIGHEQVVRAALPLFDKIIIAIGISLSKTALMPLDDRLEALRQTFAGEGRVEALSFQGLLVDLARKQGADFIVRGLRSSTDFDYELPMAHINATLSPGLQTLFIPTAADRSFVSSTLVREVVKNGGDFRPFVPAAFHAKLAGVKP